MSSYRQMRRHSRQARRAGMQPMIVINSGGPFPELAFVTLARWVWLYRSELAPLGVASCVAAFGVYAHAALSSWWPVLLAVTVVFAWAEVVFGARLSMPALLERLYVATTALACGTWDALAAALGPFTSPLPLVLGAGGLVLSVPWWANRPGAIRGCRIVPRAVPAPPCHHRRRDRIRQKRRA